MSTTATVKNAGSTYTIQLPLPSSTTPSQWVTALRTQIHEQTNIHIHSQRLLCRTLWKGTLNNDMTAKAFTKILKNLAKLKPVVIMCFEEERHTATAATTATTTTPDHHNSPPQQLFEEDVRVAVKRSAEKKAVQQKRLKKAAETHALRTRTFLETCAEEEHMAKMRKQRLILAGQWRKKAVQIHNEKQTKQAHWVCKQCTVSNFYHEKKCHVCEHVRESVTGYHTHVGPNGHSASTVVLPPLIPVFGLEGFSGTTQVASIRAMVGSRYTLENRNAHLIHLPSMLEGSTLCGSSGAQVLDGDVECAFAASDVSRAVVAVHPDVVLRGIPDWLEDNYTLLENEVVIVENGTHFGIYVCRKALQRGDVHECIAMRSWPKKEGGGGGVDGNGHHHHNAYRSSYSSAPSSLCIWFVMDGRE
jgi:hypothetical protein